MFHEYHPEMMPALWAHQENALAELRKGYSAGHRRQVLMMPTGAGKTLCSFSLIHSSLAKRKRVMFVCDLNSLIRQTSDNAKKHGLENHGIIQADHPSYNPSLPFQIASAQTLESRGFPSDPPDILIVDEAHCQRKGLIEYIKEKDIPTLGMTATPFAKGMGQTYSNIVNATTMAELTKNGVLVPLKILACTPIDMRGAKTAGGEYTDKAIEERSLRIVGDVVKEWHANAFGLKTIVFASTIDECEAYTGAFNASGAMAMSYTSRTKPDEGDEIMRDFKSDNPGIQVLLSVGRLTRGFDVPNIECGIDLRVLRKSLSELLQKLGRVIRSCPGKQNALWLDHTGNIQRFKTDIEEIYHHGLSSLDDGEKKDSTVRNGDEKEPRPCPKCGYSPFVKRCMSCGFEKSTVLVENVPGKMVEIVIGGKVAAKNDYDLYGQLCHISRMRGYSPGWAYHKYKEITGCGFPSSLPRFEMMPDITPTDAVIGKLKSLEISFRKARAKHHAR